MPASLSPDYMYPWQLGRHQNFWDKPLPLRRELKASIIRNGFAVPPKTHFSKWLGEGGVVTATGLPVAESAMFEQNFSEMMSPGKLDVTNCNAKKLGGGYILVCFLIIGGILSSILQRVYII